MCVELKQKRNTILGNLFRFVILIGVITAKNFDYSCSFFCFYCFVILFGFLYVCFCFVVVLGFFLWGFCVVVVCLVFVSFVFFCGCVFYVGGVLVLSGFCFCCFSRSVILASLFT